MNPTTPLTARELRDESTYPFELRPGRHVILRRMSLEGMFFLGVIPLPLFQAIERLDGLRAGLVIDGVSALTRLSEEDREQVLALLRGYACAVVQSPSVVPKDTGCETDLPVSCLDVSDLFAIFNARPPETPPRLTETEADAFRRAQPLADAAPGLARSDLPPAAVDVGDGS